MEADIVIKYEGGDADAHFVEMRSLGQSFLGFERVLSDGLIFLATDRLPKRGERFELVVGARAPIIGSSEIPVFLTQAAGLLPFGWWLMQTGAAEAVSHFATFVFTHLSGRKKEAQAAMEAMVKMRQIDSDADVKKQEQWLEHDAQWRDKLFDLANRLATPAIRSVAPIGPSVDHLKLNGSSAPPLLIDLPSADAIRSKGELEVSELETITLQIDGFVYHSKKLNVENPEHPGTFISADVRDPIFENVPNVYIEAAATKSEIMVQAKLGYRAGKLEKIYIMDHGDGRDHT